MKKLFFAVLLAVLSTLCVNAAKISYYSGVIDYSTDTEWGKIQIQFKKCMANKLFTFYTVKLDGKEVNSAAASDNIGPFCVNGYWMGGNHDNTSTHLPTASTLSYKAYVDGAALSANRVKNGNVLEIIVENELKYSDGVKFCTEIITYHVSGNSIEVWGEHHYEHPTTLSIGRYYGMQSMFINETEILAPGTPYNKWTKLTVTSTGNEINIPKSKAPNFCTYIEHSANGYQAAYMLREDLGNRDWVGPNSYVYIGNSWSKSYHTLIWDHSVKKGDVTNWHGIYSWFKEPIIDTCRDKDEANPIFEYGAYIDGQPVVMHLGPDGKMTETAGIEDIIVDSQPDFVQVLDGRIIISESAPNACCYDLSGKLVFKGSGSFNCPTGIYIVNDMRGHSVKLFVK